MKIRYETKKIEEGDCFFFKGVKRHYFFLFDQEGMMCVHILGEKVKYTRNNKIWLTCGDRHNNDWEYLGNMRDE